MTQASEGKKRQRKGAWERAPRTTVVNGKTIPYTVVVVAYKGQRWEEPDTPEGRAAITQAIRAVDAHEEDAARMRALCQSVAKIADRHTGTVGAKLGQAAELIRNAAETMEETTPVQG